MYRPANVIAGTFGLTAFAVAVVAGLAAGNPAGSVLLRAVISMAACYFVGTILGAVAQRATDEHINASARSATGAPSMVGVGKSPAQLTGGGKPADISSAG